MRELFGEAPGGFVVSGELDDLEWLPREVAVRIVGTVGGDALTIAIAGGRLDVDTPAVPPRPVELARSWSAVNQMTRSSLGGRTQ